ncbi:ABC transporter permease [Curtobacterium sp. MCJR17_020]|uniref:ABC transporter permease n=1 Tax=Curtobacterium sp. MCJR17_020 TaxID=2175619 RepID=UPI000DA7FD2D|nr:ABC transporter permease [Curtobacterium sp. MCJR17_020]WIE70429.1 ABC transporter permease [Curtobacterium sp. MCJR17_020]
MTDTALVGQTTAPDREVRVISGTGAERLRAASSRSRAVNVVAPTATLVGLLVIWQIVTTVGDVDPTVLPSPVRVVTSGWGERAALAAATVPTLTISVLGLLAACLVAVVVASALTFVAPLRQTLLPLLIAAQSVPIVVLAPLFVIWFGFDSGPKILLVAIVSMLPMTISTLQGLIGADPKAVTLMRSMGASTWQVFVRLRVPSALGHFVTGLRIVSSFVVVSAIFSEYVGARDGLGIYMQLQKNLFRTDLVFAAVVISIVIGLALFALSYVVEALVMPWERRRKAVQR